MEAYAPTIRKDPTIMSGSALKALAKPNNCFRPTALNEGCGKSIFLKILVRSLCLEQLYDPLYSWNLTGESAVSLCSTPWVFVARTLIYTSNKCWCSTKDLAWQHLQCFAFSDVFVPVTILFKIKMNNILIILFHSSRPFQWYQIWYDNN